MNTAQANTTDITFNLDVNALLALAIAALAILGAAAVFSPYLRVKLRRSFAPVVLGIIAVLLLAGYATAHGIAS